MNDCHAIRVKAGWNAAYCAEGRRMAGRSTPVKASQTKNISQVRFSPTKQTRDNGSTHGREFLTANHGKKRLMASERRRPARRCCTASNIFRVFGVLGGISPFRFSQSSGLHRELFPFSSAILGHHSTMGQRREARERAVQFLFQHDLNPPENLEAALDHFWDSQRGPAIAEEKASAHWGEKVELPAATVDEVATRLFADKLIRGVVEHRDELDERIKLHAQNWDLHRMAVVDRNVLRLAIYEMLHREDIPPIVSINEAVDIAKKFSTNDSGKFVNGILDKIKGELMRPARIVK
jgi:transcription antitermination protein NusB